MAAPIEHVTIVGGGTAGWMAALMLSKLLQPVPTTKKPVGISLIESPNIATVGVGEATVPGMPRTLRMAGISEQEFFRACNASFKLGVLFDRWNNGPDGKPVGYINPFAKGPPINGIDPAWYFLRYGAGDLDFTQVISPSVDLARACQGPRPVGAKPYDQTVGFAYHLDAGRFAKLMQETCVANGVNHILDDVEDVELGENGFVAALQLKENGRHAVELVIDCTGFRGLIINQALKEPFVDYSKYLANDRALAVQIPHPSATRIEPITRSTALEAGWSWRVPLFNRIGTGYVFSSAHKTDDEAREEFIAHLGKSGKDAEPRVIPMRVGRTRNGWVKNCVAIGLSGGFIEPLESTAIHMIDTGLRWLVSYFPDRDFAAPLRDRYNKLNGKLYDEVRDFICLHYALGNRTDTQYWLDAREALEVPDSLAENIELWKHGLPAPYDLEFESTFPVSTYQAVLMGKRVYETGFGKDTLNVRRSLDADSWKRYLAHIRGNVKNIVAKTADHKTLLHDIRGDAPEVKPLPNFNSFDTGQPTVSLGKVKPVLQKPLMPKSLSEDSTDEPASIL